MEDSNNYRKYVTEALIKMSLDANKSFILSYIPSLEIDTSYTDTEYRAAVDGEKIYINYSWFSRLTPSQRIFILAHEAWHIALGHPELMHRFAYPKVANIAMDYMINLMCVDDGFDIIYDAYVSEKYRDWSVMQIYLDLVKDFKKGVKFENTHGQVKASRNRSTDPLKATEAIRNLRSSSENATPEDIRKKAKNAKESYKPSIPSIKSISWVNKIKSAQNSRGGVINTYNRPSRRLKNENIRLPSIKRVGNVDIDVVLDVSGSVSVEDLNVLISYLKQVVDTLKFDSMNLYLFASDLVFVRTLTKTNIDLNIEIPASLERGTKIGYALSKLTKININTSKNYCIIFSDMEFWTTIEAEHLYTETYWVHLPGRTSEDIVNAGTKIYI